MFNRDPDPDWFHDSELDELERLSNGVVDLIESGHLDEAQWYRSQIDRLRKPSTSDRSN